MGARQTDWEALGISNDFLFGKVMQDPALCKGLLQRILPDLKISAVKYPELQKTVRPDAEAKSIRLDVYVEDDKNTMYTVEMQASDTGELPKRSRYYQSLMDMQALDRGQTYRKLNRSFIIFICLEDVFGRGRHIYTFENLCREDAGISMGDETTKIFLNADSEMDDVGGELKEFLNYAAGKSADGAFVRELEEAVRKAKQNRKWRREYMTLMMRDRVNIEKGIEQGIEQGIEEGIKRTVSILKDLGIPPQTILEKIQEEYRLSSEDAKKYM